jgi:hypothetical protein
MKNRILTLVILTFSLNTNAQIKGTIINQKDKNPIPYVNVWIENGNLGTTANEDGKFELASAKASDIFLFSALGYENKVLAFADLKELIELTPKVFELNEVKVASKKKNKELKVGIYKALRLNSFFGSGLKYPNLIARYYPYQNSYQNTPFIKKITPYCKSNIDNAKFRLRLFEATSDGIPGFELLNTNLIITVKNGDTKPVINLESYNIPFPENGLFVGLEFMFIESNIFNFEANYKEGNKITIKKSWRVEPLFALIEGESEKAEMWSLSKGKWTNSYISKDKLSTAGNKDLLAIELTLTN